jgi:hypothetical protein
MKNTKNKTVSAKMQKSKSRYFHHHKVSIEDYESIKYPNIDTKRAVIDKMLADKINELYRILDEMEEKKISLA